MENSKLYNNINIEELRCLAQKYNLDLLVLLGSYGTENFKSGESDIDIAFLAGDALQGNRCMQFLTDLSILFKYGKIDLIDLKKTSGLLKYEIADKGRLLYESKNGFFLRYSLYCLRYYYDTKKFRVLKKEYFQEKLGVLLDGEI
ncbi:type VII toxin-antitoxin system MntA family adenylyltransferase antitoxin [Candidatus Contubernalis alkaliaceticus]|uniref:type VII toxin-antitoxin system MntA family adenylyltransferase antitoxin n=1 Tax=Candidatus Contubernalis alkaliaceticus TaxID=338645 RepID=UPI001F4C507B|nr:nucleotidyltransferase domain-containing protein [Candidatus Contubernalis alkalaceticus]UNC90874.1 nucleotidyltransferase domain-containing protein [Candidatus Contubernalis alkalaceticus]